MSNAEDDRRICGLPSFDEPYTFGRTPTARWPYPFTERQLARLLILRGRVRSLNELHDAMHDSARLTPGD